VTADSLYCGEIGYDPVILAVIVSFVRTV